MLRTPTYSIELLAPARDAGVAIAAIDHGADAVYIGADSHGARAAAANSVADIGRVVEYAHRFGARVYVTLNTLIYPEETRRVQRLVRELWRADVDALIVQDLGLLRMELPPIALHASTQCDIRTPERAKFYEQLGFSQLVLPRELTLEEIRAMRRAVTVPLEAFVHGALCVSYSGQCYASLLCGGRSANRGECAQICRLPYELRDGRGRTLLTGKHLLSLKDLNRLSDLDQLIEAGVSSLKIEGRLKDASYVKNIVSAYDVALRRLGVARTSLGEVERRFRPDPERSFNRGFTTHFLYSPTATDVAAMDSPKSLGKKIGEVRSVRGNRVELRGDAVLANGDGLNFDFRGKTVGFRVNRFEPPRTIICAGAAPEGLRAGTELRRNADKRFADLLAEPDTARRTIPLTVTLQRRGELLVAHEQGGASAAIEYPQGEQARTSQLEARRKVISKLGNTPYIIKEFRDELEMEFVPASVLTRLRHRLVEALDASLACRMERPLRRTEGDTAWPEGDFLATEGNVANSLARQVYGEHGVRRIEPAPEQGGEPRHAMTMRYCLRRELGRCLRTAAGREWAEPLTLIGAPELLELEFDCRRCEMYVNKR